MLRPILPDRRESAEAEEVLRHERVNGELGTGFGSDVFIADIKLNSGSLQ
jgi:hypothetical protein